MNLSEGASLKEEAASTLQQNVANAVTEFTVSMNKLLYKRSRQQGNVIFSPMNIYSALALLHLGAAGSTRDEIANLMGLPQDDDKLQEIHETLGEILRMIANTTETSTWEGETGWRLTKTTDISLANGIFVQQGFDLKESYVSEVRSHYNGDIRNVDFANEPDKATETINEFVSESTKGRIPQVLANPVTSDTRIVLTSCLYFKANWDEQFSASSTRDELFDTGAGMASIQMMRQRDHVPYINLANLQLEAIALNYAGRDCSMFFVLPYRDQTLDNVISSIAGTNLRQIVNQSTSTYVDYKIPKMKFKWTDDINDTLVELGVAEIFGNNARLHNMLADSRLKVSQVTHAAEIEVNEKGTEASAATVVKMVLLCARIDPEPINFHVNRPFLLFIYHHKTATILFSAAVHNPNGVASAASE